MLFRSIVGIVWPLVAFQWSSITMDAIVFGELAVHTESEMKAARFKTFGKFCVQLIKRCE